MPPTPPPRTLAPASPFARGVLGPHNSLALRLVLGAGALAGGLHMTRTLSRAAFSLATSFATYAYPALRTVQALQSNDEREQRRWATYWLAVGALAAADRLVAPFVPYVLYAPLRLAVSLYLPLSEGVVELHDAVVRPLLDRHGASLDGALAAALVSLRRELALRTQALALFLAQQQAAAAAAAAAARSASRVEELDGDEDGGEDDRRL